MRSFRKFATLVACMAVLLAGTYSSPAAEEKPDKSKDKKEKADSSKGKDKGKGKSKDKGKPGKDAPQSGEPEKGKLTVPILKGHDAFGLKIPYFNADGKLQMVFNIGRASRLDDNRVSMADMLLETYNDEGGTEMSIELPLSVLNLATNVITTDTNVTIKRSDFELTGKSMEFNTETRQGKLAGDVRMLIYDLKEETAPAAEDTTKTTP